MKLNVPRTLPRSAACVTAFGFALVAPACAADLYWGSSVNQATWATAGNWFQNAEGTTAATAAPGVSDRAVFSITSLNGTAVVPRILANTSINGMTFKNEVAFNLHGGSGRLLSIGNGGVIKDAGTAAVTIGSGTGSEGILVRFAASQTWTNNSDTNLQIRNSAAAADSAGAVVLTLNTVGSGNISNSGLFSDGTGGTLAIVVDSSGSGIANAAGGNHSGGTSIRRGILQVGGTSMGVAPMRLGHTTGSADATLRIGTTSAFTTSLVVEAGNTGAQKLEFIGTSGTYDADITLNHDLNIGVRGATATGVTINGVISGGGDLIKGQYQGGNSQVLVLAGANTYTGDTLIDNGAFTLATTGSLAFAIGANGANNQVTSTGVNNSAVTFAGSFDFNLAGATLADGNSWTIVNLGALTNASFSASFGVNGFTQNNNVWTNGFGFTFSETTGLLTYSAIPEPAAAALFGGLGSFTLIALRRRRR